MAVWHEVQGHCTEHRATGKLFPPPGLTLSGNTRRHITPLGTRPQESNSASSGIPFWLQSAVAKERSNNFGRLQWTQRRKVLRYAHSGIC